MTFQEARETMRDTFKEDPDFRYAYQSNIAMLLHDRHGITDYGARNVAADDILRLVFESGSEEAEQGYVSPHKAVVLQALGEASALFMSQPVIGTSIVMPDQELADIADRTVVLLEELEVE